MSTQTMGLFEAKTHLSEVVARVEAGDEIVITRHNKPVARIVAYEPVRPVDVDRRLRAVRRMQAIGAEVAVRGGPITQDEILAWIREGRR